MIDGAINRNGGSRSQENEPRERPRADRSLAAAPVEATAN
jgi:hypothetical protein